MNLATNRAARCLIIEAGAGACLGVANSFGALFAIRLGASDQQIALLSSVPALLGLLVTIPAGRMIAGSIRPVRTLAVHLAAQRALLGLIALAPLLPLLLQSHAVVVLLIVASLPGQVAGVALGVVLAEVIPERERAQVVAQRSIGAGAVTAAGLLFAGSWLERQSFPKGYQTLYLIGFALALAGTAALLLIANQDTHEGQPSPAPRMSPRVSLRGWTPLSLWLLVQHARSEHPDFVSITRNTLAHGLGLWLIGPLYVLYYVRQLHATAAWIGLNGTIASLTPIAGFLFWQRIVGRVGENRVLIWTISLIGLYPLLVGLTPNLTLILVWTALNGLIAPGLTVSHYPMLLKICPAGQRGTYLGVYSACMGAFAFILPLVGVRLADAAGLQPVLVAGGVLCLVGSASFRRWPLATEDSIGVRP